ncbi:MAG TPA: rhodanese-like domain-containing protein, partial [Thermoanaerobaculia bacterium]
VSEEPVAVLTGDTLFIGDVGRPDLLGGRMSAAELAGQLYDSLHAKLLRLPDATAVYPAHGAGSLCGRNISSETSSTIGQQRRFNYALQPMSREAFVALTTADLPEAPGYFARDVQLNREGPGALAQLPPLTPLAPAEVAARQAAGALVLDTRETAEYGAGHIPGSVHIGQSGQFASWAGSLLSPRVPLVLVAEDEGRAAEMQTRLARVGLENVAGFLEGGIRAWDDARRPLARTEQITVDELSARLAEGAALTVLDVRRPAEWQAGRIAAAELMPLHALEKSAIPLDRGRPIAAVCRSGYRSSIATSMLERMGFQKLVNVVGGMAAWDAAHFESVVSQQ